MKINILLLLLLLLCSCNGDRATCINRLLYRNGTDVRTDVTVQQAIDACKDDN